MLFAKWSSSGSRDLQQDMRVFLLSFASFGALHCQYGMIKWIWQLLTSIRSRMLWKTNKFFVSHSVALCRFVKTYGRGRAYAIYY
jgi:hypothetical protein